MSEPVRRPSRYDGPAGPFGCHVGIGGGIDLAPARGRDLGARAIQVFVRSPRNWTFPPLTEEAAQSFREEVQNQGIVAVVAHSIYLLNLGSQDDTLWEKSLDVFTDEINRCAMLGIDRIVIHPGSAGDRSEKEGLKRIGQGLKEAIKRTADLPVTVLLETTAGTGAQLGWKLEQLAWLIDKHPRPERLGVCVDTCHSLTAGYPLHEPDGLGAFIDEFAEKIGLDKLGCLHLNDSIKPFGSRRDRHTRLGEGALGETFFARLVAEKRLHGIPKILEVPGGDQAFIDDLRLLARLARRAVGQ